jgi:hypothetical protein
LAGSQSASGAQHSARDLVRQASSWLGLERDVEMGPLVPREDSGHLDQDQFALSRTDRFKWFTLLLAVSLLFFFLSFVFLSVVIVLPGKFAFAFTCGSLCFMGAFAVAQGPGPWAAEVMRRDRLPFTLAYFGSIMGTLYATLVLRNYVAIVFFAGIQLMALSYYGATYMPGGRTGLRVVQATFSTFCSGCFKGCRGMASMLWG